MHMPHLSIQHSTNLTTERMQNLCEELLAVLVGTKLYPVGGIRVRAIPCPAGAFADCHPNNAFADLVFRIGAGRSEADKKMTGELLMKTAEAHFAIELASPHFALSLEIIEIDPVFSWKTNSIHPRLKGQS
jgi:5-carboxymethyl-2-hydroxymuconate isomerase